MEDQSARIKGVENSLAEHSRQIGELKKNQSSLLEEINESVGEQMKSFKEALRRDNKLFRAELINEANHKVDRKVDLKLEQATTGLREEFMEEKGVSHMNNLIVMGLQEAKEGDTDRDQVKSLFKDRMNITGLRIDSVHRRGKPGGSCPRPLFLRFPWLIDRNKVWFAKSKLKSDDSPKIWLQEDLPKPIRVVQRALYQAFKRAKSLPCSFTSVQLKGTRLILDGKAYGPEDMDALPPVLQPSNMATRHSELVIVFFGRASPLSNHHHSIFNIEGHRFSSMEQFLAWKKAKLSGRKSLINKALASTNPK